ncbi:MAG: DUF6338 family protein [bacterium]
MDIWETQRDFSKSLYEVIGNSALNYAALSWLIIWLYSGNFYQENRNGFIVSVVFIVFIVPALWPILFTRLWKWSQIAKHITHSIKKPWDYVFGKGELYWMIVHLKD